MVTPKSSRESIQIAKLLSEKNSPLANIIKGISDNTTLTIDNRVAEKAGSKIADWLNRAGLSKLLGAEGEANVKNELATLKQATPVDDAFADFHILTETANDQPPAINGITEAINDLYVYLVAVNVAVEKGVDLPPDDPFVKYKAEVNRLPSPFRQMLDNFSEIILKNTDKIVDEKLMSTLEKQLATLTNSCQETRQQGYPFERGSENNVALESFSSIFGPNGIYNKFTNLSGEAAVLARSEKLETLTAKNSTFKDRFSKLDDIAAIRQGYFDKGSETPSFDFAVKVLILDASLESVNISYDGKSYVYSHGPVNPATFTWPSKNENALAKIDISSPQINSAGISATGPWSIFRLIEKGKILRQTGNTTVVEYNIQGKNIVVEFTTSTAFNPFNLNKLRNFQCV